MNKQKTIVVSLVLFVLCSIFLVSADANIWGRILNYDTTGTNYISTEHSGTNGYINTSIGGISLYPNSGTVNINGSLTFIGGQPVSWNTDEMTLDVPTGLGNTIQVGQELTTVAKNREGVIIYSGQVVYFSGAYGNSPAIKLADSSDGDKIHNIGIVTIPSCDINADCPITTYGIVRELNTSSWIVGTELYLDGSGILTNISQVSPNYNIHVATVLYQHATLGAMIVNPEIDIGDGVVMNSLSLNTNLLIGPPVGQYSFYNTDGDLFLGNGSQGIYNGQLGIWALQYGAPLIVNSHGSDLVISSLGGTATLTTSTQIFCDTTAPFTIDNVGMYIEILSSTPSFAGATGEIIELINSSCIVISFASAGGNTIVDATGMTFIVYPQPIFSVLDNGDIHAVIGENADASFKIAIPNGTNAHGVHIVDVAGDNEHSAFEINQDKNNKFGSIGMLIYTESEVETEADATNIYLEINLDKINNSKQNFITMRTIGNVKGNEIDGIDMSSNIEHLIHVGSGDDFTKVYDNGIDITTAVQTSGSTHEIFSADDDVLYIGSDVNFTTISVEFFSVSSKNIKPKFFYCNTAGNWVALVGATSTTDGGQTSGSLLFANPTDRGVCNQEMDGTPFTNTTNYAYVGIQRTQRKTLTAPVLDVLTIAGATDSFLLATDYMKLNPVNTEPITCGGAMLGAIYFDISEDDLCQCASGGWEVIRDGSTCI